MGSFSASDAALEGFQVIRTQWRVILGWCLFSLIGFVALVVAAIAAVLVATVAVKSPDDATMAGATVGVLVLGLGGAAIQWVVLTALYRMTLRSDPEPGLYHLRISRDEGRLFGLWLALTALFVALMTAGFLALRALGQVSGPAAGLGTLVFLALVLWLAIRTSLAGPANFATGRFGLADSWRLTRGRFWPLLGMILLAVCLLALIAIVLFILTAVVQAAIGGFHTLAPVRHSIN